VELDQPLAATNLIQILSEAEFGRQHEQVVTGLSA